MSSAVRRIRASDRRCPPLRTALCQTEDGAVPCPPCLGPERIPFFWSFGRDSKRGHEDGGDVVERACITPESVHTVLSISTKAGKNEKSASNFNNNNYYYGKNTGGAFGRLAFLLFI